MRDIIIILGVPESYRRFYPKFWGIIMRKWLHIFYSKYCPSLATAFDYISGNLQISSRKSNGTFDYMNHNPFFRKKSKPFST